MAKEIPAALRRIRNLYPTAKCDRMTWRRIDDLASSGDPEKIAQAEALAKACSTASPAAAARHAGALEARRARRRFLVAQAAAEREIDGILRGLADRAAVLLARAEDGGAIPPVRAPKLIERLKDANREAYADVARVFARLLRVATDRGVRAAMDQAEVVQDAMKAAQAREADATRQTVRYAVKSDVFKKLFVGTLKTAMRAGLFAEKKPSRAVWDLRDENYLRLKRQVGSGIAQGKSAAEISRDIRGLLVQPKTLRGRAFDESRPGPGVYRSAYRNAMRVTRTESNRAYVMADRQFAKEKKWNILWQVSTGNRERDECDDLHGKIMTPEEFDEQYPRHPQCLCYSVTVPNEG